ncbi:MAG: 3-oxoacid CoA-transferase [Gemmataceae bacterium]|nr:3-oxoacid CoA-transferase [Gemmataceae bacterium]
MNQRSAYNAMELMICCAARCLEDGKSVAVGTGVPCAAAMLAQRTTAPNLMICFEAGGVAPLLPTMPISVGDSRTFWRGLMATSMADVMETCQRGLIDYTFLGGAQIDAYGNLNSTMIGTDYRRPKTRLPGSGGANDLASLCWRILVVTKHDRRRFVEKLDFMTTPGYLTGPGAREAAGLPRDTGPYRVITDLAILGYHAQSKRMEVLSLHPGVALEQVQAHTGFPLGVAADVKETPPPTDTELRILREEVDPYRYVIGRAD